MITGIAGFLGSYVADRMLNLGWEVVGVDNLAGGTLKNVHKDVTFYNEDCLNIEKMRELSKGCDIVFHAACTAHDGLSVFSPHEITQNTFQNTMSVLSASISNNVKKFVYCSSMSRYGVQKQTPFTEDMKCNPQVPYAIAKYTSELAIKQLSKVHDFKYLILVPHNIIGPRQKYDDPYRNVASIMINRMLQGKQPIIYGDGNHQRCFSFISDVVDCIEKSITDDSIINEIINIGPDEEFVTINFLAKTIAKLLNFDLKPIYVDERPMEVEIATCSSDKARQLLGYETQVTLEEGLQQMINYIRKEGTKSFDYGLINLEINNEKTPKTWKNKLI